MPNMLHQVKEFMTAMNQDMGDTISWRSELLRIRLITEEANETAQAIYTHDMPMAIDGLCDQLYVILGTFIAFGFTSEQVATFFNEVHRSNMSKIGGGLDDFGKVQKPKDWTPPDIQGILEDMLYEYFVIMQIKDRTDTLTILCNSELDARQIADVLKENKGFINIIVERRRIKIGQR